MKLTKLGLHFSDPGSEVPTPIGSFEFLLTRGSRSAQNNRVGSSDRVSEVPITIGSVRFLPTKGAQPARFNRIGSSDPMSGVPTSTFSTKNRNPYCGKTNQQKSKSL